MFFEGKNVCRRMLMLKYDSHDVISCLGKNKNRLFLIYSFRGTLITSNVSEFHY